MIRSVICFTLVIICILFYQSSAFDGHRKGFIIGFGMGVGINTTTNSTEINYPENSNRIFKYNDTGLAIMTDRLIGYALSDLWGIYLINKNAYPGFFSEGDGVIGLGVAKMSTIQIPAKYYAFGIGVPFMETISWKFNRDNFGLYGGWGYEFRKHLSLEFNLLYGHRVSRHGVEKETDNNFSLRFSFNALAY